MSFHFRMRGQVVTLAGLAFAGIVPFAMARVLPSTLPANRTAHGAKQAELPSFSSALAAQAANPQRPYVPPPRPLVAEQPATKPPQVTYEDGQLTIIAENSLLSDILSALHTVMGAEIDLPASASGQRIWVRLGPGPARRVVSELLSGTELNYVIQGSETDVDGIRSVSLTPHAKAADGPGTSTERLARVANRRLPQGSPGTPEVPEQENPAPPELLASSDPAPADPAAPSAGPLPAAADLQSAAGGPGSNASRPVARTTEQMIQQLQSMYQQRRQIQQNRNTLGPNQ
jgi:hypothetical protein